MYCCCAVFCTTSQNPDSAHVGPSYRSDGYGEIGTGPYSFLRKVRMYCLFIFLGIPRIFCCLLLLIIIRTVCALIQCMPSLRPILLPATASFVSRGMLLVLGFLNIRHKRIMKDPDLTQAAQDLASTRSKRRSLPIIVSNHVSWVDILLAGFLYRCDCPFKLPGCRHF